MSDFVATPFRIRMELWFRLNGVLERRGVMSVLPGSHRPIMEYWDRVLADEHKAMLLRLHGLRPAPAPAADPLPGPALGRLRRSRGNIQVSRGIKP